MLLDTPICDFGWQAPDFELKDPEGNNHVMSSYLGEKGLLITFICNHCPYVQAIAERFSNDAKELQRVGINVLAIMSNDYLSFPADSPEHMKLFSDQYDFSFPYLIDESQLVAKKYSAICTPDFFGLNGHGELQYRGRLDNLHMNNTGEREKELINAMLQIAETGHGPKQQEPSMGCSIKWRR